MLACVLEGGTDDDTRPGVPSPDPVPVSVFLAVRDEEHDLEASIDRILAQDHPGDLEVVVAVGPSSDATWDVATDLARRHPRLTVVENPAGTTPQGLNAAVRAARHDVLVRVDGHAFVPTDYVRRVVALLQSTGAANVGGRMVPRGSGPVSSAVAVVMGSRFGIGGGAFHVGGRPGPQPTVYLGAFRRGPLEEVGGYDEYFVRAQDWELNHRLRAAGHEVWFDPSIAVGYQPRSSWRAFARQQWRTGGWRRRVIERYPSTVSPRYLAPPTVVVAVAAGTVAAAVAPLTSAWLALGLLAPVGYAGAVAVVGLHEGRREPWPVRRRLPVAMALMHLSWGAGFLRKAR